MKRSFLTRAVVIGLLGAVGCSRKAAPAKQAAPEVLVTTVVPRDVPRVLERVATLDGFINANINAQVQGYIVSKDYQEGSIRYEVTFPNPGGNLRPGQFGKIRFVADTKKGAMVIPQEAVSELQGSHRVAVVDEQRKVSIKPVKLGERIAAMWELTEAER